jgi:hypothetical protein
MDATEPTLYPKMYAPLKRATSGRLKGRLTPEPLDDDATAAMRMRFVFTEKVDGTNIRVHWDGYSVSFWGRTSRTKLHPELVEYLSSVFTEEAMEATFQDRKVTLFGEGIGKKIQSGLYGDDYKFVMFDTFFEQDYDSPLRGIWSEPMTIFQLSRVFNVPSVEQFSVTGTLREGIRDLPFGRSRLADVESEGWIATAVGGLLTRTGKRIKYKLKAKDILPVRELIDWDDPFWDPSKDSI